MEHDGTYDSNNQFHGLAIGCAVVAGGYGAGHMLEVASIQLLLGALICQVGTLVSTGAFHTLLSSFWDQQLQQDCSCL